MTNLQAQLLVLYMVARWAGHQWGNLPLYLLAQLHAQSARELCNQVEALVYQRLEAGPAGWGRVSPSLNEASGLAVHVGRGLEVGFDPEGLYIRYANPYRGAALEWRPESGFQGQGAPRDYARLAAVAALLGDYSAYDNAYAEVGEREFVQYFRVRDNAGHLLAAPYADEGGTGIVEV